MTYGEVTYSSVRLTYSAVSSQRFAAAELLRSNVAAHYGMCATPSRIRHRWSGGVRYRGYVGRRDV